MLFGKGEDVNIVTVTENCIRNSVFDSQESARTYLFKLSEMSVEKSSIESYAEILDDIYVFALAEKHLHHRVDTVMHFHVEMLGSKDLVDF